MSTHQKRGGGPKGCVDADPEIAGAWQGRRELARHMGADPSYIAQSFYDGTLCRGWTIERRPCTEADYASGVDGRRHYMWRAVQPETRKRFALCDVVCGRLIPEVWGTREQCERAARGALYRHGPPTRIIELDERPELGVVLRGQG